MQPSDALGWINSFARTHNSESTNAEIAYQRPAGLERLTLVEKYNNRSGVSKSFA
jgi:hypothetical protein